ncbi:MAG: NAD-dependent deacylase [Chitinophagaceae bacterium]|nr:NAD-dependent deacylase [Chitinophagaceae bacterium]
MSKQKLVVLSGAGISAESGLKTFRDSDGLWEGYDISEVATPTAWKRNPALVLQFYNERRRNVAEARPNTAHYGLAELEQYFDVTIITQNIDDLHERAGSSNVLHLHGEIFKMRSEKNEHLIKEIRGDIHLGDLAEDGHQYRPHVVWFEEPVPMMEKAIPIVKQADIFVVIGTSLVVYPAAGLIYYVRPGVPVFVIDKKIPYVSLPDPITPIEKSATEGVAELKKILMEKYLSL